MNIISVKERGKDPTLYFTVIVNATQIWMEIDMTEDQLTDKAKINLDSLDKMLNDNSMYWTFGPSEKKIGEFDPEKLPKVVPSPFNENQNRYEFELFDIKKGKVMFWNVSRSTAKKLSIYLREGFRTFEIERIGTGLKTDWKINPVIEDENE